MVANMRASERMKIAMAKLTKKRDLKTSLEQHVIEVLKIKKSDRQNISSPELLCFYTGSYSQQSIILKHPI